MKDKNTGDLFTGAITPPMCGTADDRYSYTPTTSLPATVLRGSTAEESASRETPGSKDNIPPGTTCVIIDPIREHLDIDSTSDPLAEAYYAAEQRQPWLTGEAHARADDPDTSHLAAESISPRLRELQQRVLRYAASQPDGFTDIDLNRHFGSTGSTFRTRRSELVDKGYIADSGERRTYGPEGKPGRRFIIWIITPEGRKAQEEQ